MDLLKLQTKSGSEFLSDGNRHPPVLRCIPMAAGCVCGKQGAGCVSEEFCVCDTWDGNNHI